MIACARKEKQCSMAYLIDKASEHDVKTESISHTQSSTVHIRETGETENISHFFSGRRASA